MKIDQLLKAVRNDPQTGPRFIASEALDKEAKTILEFVDLEIEFSPVLLHGTSTSEAMKVDYIGEDGRGVIKEPYQILTHDELKMGRARYLVAKGNERQSWTLW